MDRGQVSSRIAALREECAALGRELAEDGLGLAPEEAFAVAGEAQRLANSADGLVAVAASLGARVEVRLSGSGSGGAGAPGGVRRRDGRDEMFCLEAGLTEGLAGRKVALGAALGERFPQIRALLLAGEVSRGRARRRSSTRAPGSTWRRARRVDAELAGRLAVDGPGPGRPSEARRVAARVAADQVAAHAAMTRRGRCVEVRPGVDGLTDWFASLPTATRAAMWSAVEELAGEYRAVDDTLSVPESRADALTDLVLRNVTVSAQVTLGVPVVTDRPAPEAVSRRDRSGSPWDDDETVIDAVTGDETRYADLDPASPARQLSWREEPTLDPRDRRRRSWPPVTPGYAVSGTQLPGVGWVDAATVANLLASPPAGRRPRRPRRRHRHPGLPDHRPPTGHPKAIADFVKTRDGTCRMWGCTRPADHTDLDHTRPWPAGATSPDEPRRPLPPPPPVQAARPLATHPRPRRHPHLARPQRPDPHHRTRPPPPPRTISLRRRTSSGLPAEVPRPRGVRAPRRGGSRRRAR